MARQLLTGGAMTNSSVVVPPSGSVACWWQPLYAPTDGVSHVIVDQRITGDEANTVITIAKLNDNNWYCGWYNHAEYRVIVAAAGTFSLQVYCHLALTWDAAIPETKFYINGSQVGATSVTLSPFTPTNTFTIGNESDAVVSALHWLAEFAIYTVALTAGDVASLALGFSPLLVRRSALAHYWPLIGQDSPEIELVGRADGTLAGSTQATLHPRVIYPSRRRTFFQPPSVLEDLGVVVGEPTIGSSLF